jgi:hypothetical protein
MWCKKQPSIAAESKSQLRIDMSGATIIKVPALST